MKTKTFWTILLKILGVSILLSSLTIIPQFFSTVYTITKNGSNNNAGIPFLLIFTLVVYLLILRLFVFKPEWIIAKLKLERNMEEKIDFEYKSFNYT